MSLSIKSEQECRWDIASLGEVMLRLDPGEGRIHTTRSFRVCEGGGEYNVARGLRRCFRMRGAIVTAICDNPVGRLLEDCMLQGGLDLDYVKWAPFDGIGRDCRVGLNFTERGYGVRAAVGCSDRGLSAACQMKPTWTGTPCSAGTACAGSIPAAFMRDFPKRRATWCWKPSRPPASTARSFPMT